jgi:hypothetical protein
MLWACSCYSEVVGSSGFTVIFNQKFVQLWYQLFSRSSCLKYSSILDIQDLIYVFYLQGSPGGGVEFGYSIGVDHGNGYSYQTRTGFDALG